MSDNIKVAIKVRPLIKGELEKSPSIQWTVKDNAIAQVDSDLKKRGDSRFQFDHIFDKNVTNNDVFDAVVKPIVDATVNGFNGTVFAYGQTSSGKTYTMMGAPCEPGIIPLAVERIFDAIANTNGREFLLRVSYLEIYMESLNDLLDKKRGKLKIHEDNNNQLVVKCKEEITSSPEHVLTIMKMGEKNRRIGETNMNERSSRSHTIFRIIIESRQVDADSDGAIQVSQLNLVDLAGSERASKTGATGERFNEGVKINASLSALGLVINELSTSQDHIHFRNSKLTRLLQTSLGGNAMTLIICAVTPAALEETQCTLQFAARAKSIKNKPKLNEVMSDQALLKRHVKQLAKLHAELQELKEKSQFAAVEEMESKLQEKDRLNQFLEYRIELLKKGIVSSSNQQESFKCKAKRRQTWCGHVTSKQTAIVVPQELPTIIEMSPIKSVIKSTDIMNHTFQTAFADFELELIQTEGERMQDRLSEGGFDSEEIWGVTKRRNSNHVHFTDNDSVYKYSSDTTPEKKNASSQVSLLSPGTPKEFLRERIADLMVEFEELQEFTTLEKQCNFEEYICSEQEKIKNAKLLESDQKVADLTSENIELRSTIKELLEKLEVIKQQNQLSSSPLSNVLKISEQVEKDNSNKFSVSIAANISLEQTAHEKMNNTKVAELEQNTADLFKDVELTGTTDELQLIGQYNQSLSDLENFLKPCVEVNENTGNGTAVLTSAKTFSGQIMHKTMDNNAVPEVDQTSSGLSTKNVELTAGVVKNDKFEPAEKQNDLLSSQLDDSKKVWEKENTGILSSMEDNVNDQIGNTALLEVDQTLLSNQLHHTYKDSENINKDMLEQIAACTTTNASLVEDNGKLTADLHLKIQELHEFKNDVQELRLDIENLHKTIYLLTSENTELSSKLITEEKQCKEREDKLQKEIDEYCIRTSKLMEENSNVQYELAALRHLDAKEQNELKEKIVDYENQIRMLIAENKKLSNDMTDTVKELKNIKESKSVNHTHECQYTNTPENANNQIKALEFENNELSNILMDRTDENDRLKEECEILKSKLEALLKNNKDVMENNLTTVLTEENIHGRRNASLEYSEGPCDIEKINNTNTTALWLSRLFESSDNDVVTKVLSCDNCHALEKKVTSLEKEKNHFMHLTNTLYDLTSKLVQCTNLKHTKSHKVLNCEEQSSGHNHKDLQLKCDEYCIGVEALKVKVNKILGEDAQNTILNFSLIDELNIADIEEKIRLVNNELEFIENTDDSLSNISKDERNDLDNSTDETPTTLNHSFSLKKALHKNESKIRSEKIERLQNKVDQVKQDISGDKESILSVKSHLNKHDNRKRKLINELEETKICNVKLTETMVDKESCVKTINEHCKTLEHELLEVNRQLKEAIAIRDQLEMEQGNVREDMRHKHENEMNSVSKNLEEYIKESENQASILIEKLSQYMKENENMKQEISNLHREILNTNTEELRSAKNCIIKEIKSLKLETDCENLKNKSISELFQLFVRSIMAKEEEVMKALQERSQQSADAEKRTKSWAAQLEDLNGKLQEDLAKCEKMNNMLQDKISQTQHELHDCNCEKNALKEKIDILEADFNNVQMELEKHCKVGNRQEEAILLAQKKEKLALEMIRSKEDELQSKFKLQTEEYKKRIQECNSTIESYKTKIMELQSTVEGLEANESQSMNIINIKSTEITKNNQCITMLKGEITRLTEDYDKVSKDIEIKKQHIDEITAHLKIKCDLLSEYKIKLDTIGPEHELLKEHANDRKNVIEQYKTEIETLRVAREKDLQDVNDKLHAEEMKNSSLNNQLIEVTNTYCRLLVELDTMKNEFTELGRENEKLKKKVRNSTSKIKSEADMEELRDVNRTLQCNLDGASNRILELQEQKNQLSKEVVDLKTAYDCIKRENIETQKLLTVYKTKLDNANLPFLEGRYDTLLQEKNKMALELEEKKLLLNRSNKELEHYMQQVNFLTEKNKELDVELDELADVIREKDAENAKLEEKLYAHLSETDICNECKSKIEALIEETERYKFQLTVTTNTITTYKKEIHDLHQQNDKLYAQHAELCSKITDLESKLESKTSNSNSRRQCRNDAFNQRRQLESVMDFSVSEANNDEHCLRSKIHELELELVTKQGKIATLELQIQSENFPYLKKCKDLQENLRAYRNRNSELMSDISRLQKERADINAGECDICRQWRINRNDQSTQTIPNNKKILFCGTSSGIIEDDLRIQKLEKEKVFLKKLCHNYHDKIKNLEQRLKLLDVQTSSVLQPIDAVKENVIMQPVTTPLITSNDQLEFDKNLNEEMKENIPQNLLEDILLPRERGMDSNK